MSLPFRPRRYETIAHELQRGIEQGEFARLGRLPSERLLMERFGVQRNTVRKALELLRAEGWIRVEEKRGAFLAERTEARRIEPFRPIPDGMDLAVKTVFVVNAHNDESQAVSKLLDGLFEALHASGMGVLRYDSRPGNGSKLQRIPTPEEFDRHDVAGILLWPQNPSDAAALARLRAVAPLILIDRRVLGLTADCVRFDDEGGGRQIAEHLIRKGHRRIGFIADEAFADTVQHRWRGYMLAMEAAGLLPSHRDSAFFAGAEEPLLRASVLTILADPANRPTALICSNDGTAIAVIRVLREAGLRVPEDVAVVGYGDLLPDYLDTIGLTTVAQPFREAGMAAGRLLLDRILSPSPEVRDIELPVRVVERATCALPSPRPEGPT
ncbi:MAG: GntR family transcriptional regulator [Fimbriimonas sp.]